VNNNQSNILIVNYKSLSESLSESLAPILDKRKINITSISSSNDIIKTLDKLDINLIIFDIVIYNKKAIYWLKWLKSYHPYIPTIISSNNLCKESRLNILEQGAYDYILKPFLEKELLIKIDRVINSTQIRCKYQNINIGNLVFNTRTNCIVINGSKEVRLTGLESDILKLLCLKSGNILSRDDIMEQTKGVKHNPLDRSIDIHINSLRKKIEEVPSSPQYIHTVRGKGYRLQHNI
jgi:DNA-binding response OmpR family regulator